jgi:hypothetical protein
MSEAWREMLTAWKDYRVIAEEFTEVDVERVLVSVCVRGRGRTSGVELEQTIGTARGANLFHVRSDTVTRLVGYWDRDHALADLGLAPEGDAA